MKRAWCGDHNETERKRNGAAPAGMKTKRRGTRNGDENDMETQPGGIFVECITNVVPGAKTKRGGACRDENETGMTAKRG